MREAGKRRVELCCYILVVCGVLKLVLTKDFSRDSADYHLYMM